MRGAMRVFIITTIIMSVFAAGTMADWIPEDGHKMHFPQLPDEAGWDVYSSATELVADDWQCSETGVVTDIHFWGSWKGGVTGEIHAFHLYVFSDVPADPPEVPYSRPGQLLFDFEVPIGMVAVLPIASAAFQGWYNPNLGEWLIDDHTDYYQYNIFLPLELQFSQEQGTIYWLGVAPIVADPQTTSWGWKSSLDHWNDDGVYMDLSGEWHDLHTPPFDGFYDYIPGDVDDDGDVDMSDAIYYNNWWMGIYPPPPFEVNGFYPAADVNADCIVNSGDPVYLMGYLQSGGSRPMCCYEYPAIPCAPSMDMAFVINGAAEICDCIPGDPNNDGYVNVADIVYIIAYVFKGGPAPTPYPICSGDHNGDCVVDVGDAVAGIGYVFKGSLPPPTCEVWVSVCGWPLRK